jgi:hypothetical protein
MQHYENTRTKSKYSGTRFEGQVKRAFREFYREEPQTMLMVEVKTNIMRANLCRYVSHWKKLGVIFLVHKGKCPISKTLAGFYSTHPRYMPTAQLNMFQ